MSKIFNFKKNNPAVSVKGADGNDYANASFFAERYGCTVPYVSDFIQCAKRAGKQVRGVSLSGGSQKKCYHCVQDLDALVNDMGMGDCIDKEHREEDAPMQDAAFSDAWNHFAAGFMSGAQAAAAHVGRPGAEVPKGINALDAMQLQMICNALRVMAGTYEVNAEETQDELTKYALFHQADEARHLIDYIESWGVMQKITNRADKMKKNN